MTWLAEVQSVSDKTPQMPTIAMAIATGIRKRISANAAANPINPAHSVVIGFYGVVADIRNF